MRQQKIETKFCSSKDDGESFTFTSRLLLLKGAHCPASVLNRMQLIVGVSLTQYCNYCRVQCISLHDERLVEVWECQDLYRHCCLLQLLKRDIFFISLHEFLFWRRQRVWKCQYRHKTTCELPVVACHTKETTQLSSAFGLRVLLMTLGFESFTETPCLVTTSPRNLKLSHHTHTLRLSAWARTNY